MMKLKSEFRSECRKLAAELATHGYDGRKLCAGAEDSVQGLAGCVIKLRRALMMAETSQALDEWGAQEEEAGKIIKLNDLSW